MSDPGLWFVNGVVSSHKIREQVWKEHEQKWSRLFVLKRKLEKKQNEEMAKVEKKFELLNKQQPYTPWVGHVVDGAVPSFVENARQEWLRRKPRTK